MSIERVFLDKTLKSKAKVAAIGELLGSKELSAENWLNFVKKQKAVEKSICIEAMEYATKRTPEIVNERILECVSVALKDDEARVKWESARVIANIAHLFPDKLDRAINNLLSNAESDSKVVRWATALALAEILKLDNEIGKVLRPIIQGFHEKEEDSGVKKKYASALRKVRK